MKLYRYEKLEVEENKRFYDNKLEAFTKDNENNGDDLLGEIIKLV